MLWMDTTRLTCVPDDLLKKLVELWNSFLSGQSEWPDSMKLAKIVTPKKTGGYEKHDGRTSHYHFVFTLSSPL